MTQRDPVQQEIGSRFQNHQVILESALESCSELFFRASYKARETQVFQKRCCILSQPFILVSNPRTRFRAREANVAANDIFPMSPVMDSLDTAAQDVVDFLTG